ncbi:MAG: phosphotransferase, partial [Thermodesulfobacteriota bacterium]
MALPAVIKALLKPSAYPKGCGKVTLLQTHISYILLTGKYAYKIKKPVDFGFLDFTALEKRLYFCKEEVRLNRRLAPDIYIGVVPVVRVRRGYRVEGKGRIVEYAVKMKRIPDEVILERMIKEETITTEIIKRIADRIASFHKHALTNKGISGFGKIEIIKQNGEENFSQVSPFIGTTISNKRLNKIRAFAEGFLRKNAPLFKKRVEAGFIRDCHGDIHSEHIGIEDGIFIFDCIEFNRRFRYCDVVSDAAFLSMDLEFRGRPDLAKIFEKEYFSTTGDSEGKRLLDFYKCYRAFVRGKVEGFKLNESEESSADKKNALLNALLYFDLSYKYATGGYKPALLLVCGLIGTGKSTVARLIASRTGMAIISSDETR